MVNAGGGKSQARGGNVVLASRLSLCRAEKRREKAKFETGGTPVLRGRIKFLAQQHVQVVSREGEFTEDMRGFLVQRAAFEFPLHPPKAFAQGERFLGITELLKQTFYFFNALQGGVNSSNGLRWLNLPGFDVF